jgi:hypothetical protein
MSPSIKMFCPQNMDKDGCWAWKDLLQQNLAPPNDVKSQASRG